MVGLEPIGPDNWRVELSVREDQRRFVSDPNRILARAYAYREEGSQARLILDGEDPAGMLMWYGCPEQGRYVFSQLLIDQRYQGRGLGMAAARMALDEGRYSKVCLCYVEGDEPARLLYEKLGFRHTGAAEENEIVMELTL